MCNNSMTVTYEDVVKARQTQNEVIRKTNLEFSETFSKICGANVYLKNEYEQKTGSFKIRGAYSKIKSLTDSERVKVLLLHLQEITHKELHLHLILKIYLAQL